MNWPLPPPTVDDEKLAQPPLLVFGGRVQAIVFVSSSFLFLWTPNSIVMFHLLATTAVIFHIGRCFFWWHSKREYKLTTAAQQAKGGDQTTHPHAYA